MNKFLSSQMQERAKEKERQIIAKATSEGRDLTEEEKKEIQVPMVGTIPKDAVIVTEPKERNYLSHIWPITTNAELSLEVKARLQQVFHDLIGVRIMYAGKDVGGNDIFTTSMYFEFNEAPTDGKLRNLIKLDRPQDDSMYSKNLALQNKKDGKIYTLSDETKLLLSDFMPGGRDQNKPGSNNWEKYIKESMVSVDNLPMYRPQSFKARVVVSGFDTRKLMSLVYGTTMLSSVKYNADGKATNYESKVPKYRLKFNGQSYMNQGNQYNSICNIIVEQFDENNVNANIARMFPNIDNKGSDMFW